MTIVNIARIVLDHGTDHYYEITWLDPTGSVCHSQARTIDDIVTFLVTAKDLQ